MGLTYVICNVSHPCPFIVSMVQVTRESVSGTTSHVRASVTKDFFKFFFNFFYFYLFIFFYLYKTKYPKLFTKTPGHVLSNYGFFFFFP